MENIELVIKALRDSDRYIESIFLQGGCYQFHLFLKTLYPSARPLIDSEKSHVVSLIDDDIFDVTGKVSGDMYFDLTDDDYREVEKWSFARTSALSLGECAHCEEPILI